MADEPTPNVSSASTVTSNKDAWAAVITGILAELVKLVLAVAIVCINAGVLYLVLTKTLPAENKDLIIAIVNGTGMAQGLALGYYFGSSAGSAAKDKKGP